MNEVEFIRRQKFWNKKTFRNFTVKEVESRSRKIQKIMAAIKDMDREEAIKFLNSDWRYKSESDYILSIIPVTFKCHE